MRFRDPPASPTRVGAATRPLRCPLRGRIESLAATARGLGWRKSRQVKVFCPAFLQKSGRGPGAEPLGVSLCFKSAGGGQRGNPRRGFPLCGRPPPPGLPVSTAVTSVSNGRSGRRGRRPLQGGCGDVGLVVYRRPGEGGTPPLQTNFYVFAFCSPRQPRRGRRPRRPAVTVFANLTAFRPPRPGRRMISQYTTRHAVRFPPAVGVGVLDDPFLRPLPAPRCRAGCGRRSRPQRGDPRRGSPL